MLTLSLNTYDGQEFLLPMLLQWELIHTGGVPCDSMSVTCLYTADMADILPKATRFTATYNGKIVLKGVVDAYEVSMSRKGLLVEVEGRGMAALLLDNESEAVTYDLASLPEILDRHVSPYGIQTKVHSNFSGSDYAVISGSSQWKAVQGFVRRFGGFDPYFTPEGALVAASLWGSGETVRISDDTPLLSLGKREQRYGVISEMLIQDKVQGIRHRVTNKPFIAAGGQRRHVLYMPRSTADQRRYTGEYQIAQSALEQVEIAVELPIAFAAFPGDRVELALSKLGLHGIYEVVESRCRMDEAGERTTLILSVR